jgi:phosphate:Na+ symporter
MLKKLLLPSILLILTYGFWVSPDFKTIASGVAIFLFGMLSLEQGFSAFTVGLLERALKRATSSRLRSLSFGMISTAIMQSSSLVSVIAISFLSAGLISLAAGIGIVFGANLGTTTGAWLIAGFGLKVDIAKYAMPMLVFGIVLLFQPSKKFKGAGYILCGLGFLFLGIHYIKEGFDTFKDTIDLASYSVSGYLGVLLFMVIGIFATVVIQSSHATLVLIITALAAQQITYENALALAIGANIGTTITAILGALNANASGKRLAGAHLIFNMITAMLAVAFIFQLVELVDWVAAALGISNTDYTLKLAIFHTIFNVVGVLVMLPLINLLVTTLERLIPEHLPEVDQPKFLSNASAEFPNTAIEAVKNETLRIYDSAIDIIASSLGLSKDNETSKILPVEKFDGQPLTGESSIDAMYEKHIKTIYSAILAFISDTTFSRREEHSAGLQWLREANAQIVEAIKDTKHLQKNLQRYMVSSNPDIRNSYNTIRSHIATIIQEILEIRQQENGVMDMLSLDALKLVIDEHKNAMTEEMTKLIANRKISPQMGSSLLNDSTYAHEVSMSLVLAAQTLFGASEPDLLHAARTVTLDDSERNIIE